MLSIVEMHAGSQNPLFEGNPSAVFRKVVHTTHHTASLGSLLETQAEWKVYDSKGRIGAGDRDRSYSRVRRDACTGFGWSRLLIGIVFIIIAMGGLLPGTMQAAGESASSDIPIISVNIGQSGDNPRQVSTAVKILAILTILSIAPGLMVTLTSFTRIVIILSFLRQALGIQQIPPNQVLIGLSLFITLFVMGPVMDQIYAEAYQPFMAQQIGPEEAFERAASPLKEFMLKFTREKDLALFLSIANQPRPSSVNELSLRILVPSFIISELRTAFQIGFMIYLPFLVIDIIVSSILLSMGMMVLPPMLISLPLKLMLFVLVDGWNLLVESLVRSFQ